MEFKLRNKANERTEGIRIEDCTILFELLSVDIFGPLRCLVKSVRSIRRYVTCSGDGLRAQARSRGEGWSWAVIESWTIFCFRFQQLLLKQQLAKYTSCFANSAMCLGRAFDTHPKHLKIPNTPEVVNLIAQQNRRLQSLVWLN